MTATAGCTFAYDGDGSRVQKTGCGATIYYWRDLAGTTLEESATSTMVREFVFFGGKRVARRDVVTNTVHYFVSDHLGSTSLITNASGAMPAESESDYYPYGGEIIVTAATIQDQNYKFTGKERDSQSGLDNFGARYDSSALGRFMTPDWAAKAVTVPYAKFGDPQTLNLYAYGENSPINQADADGHCAEPFFDLSACNGEQSAPPNSGVGAAAMTAEQQDLPSGLSTLGIFALVQVPVSEQSRPDTATPPPSPTPDPAGTRTDPDLNPTGFTPGRLSYERGGQGKGERGQTSKPDGTSNPTKGVQPVRDKNGKVVGYSMPSQSGKRTPKSLDWGKANGLDPNTFQTAAKIGVIGGIGAAAAYAIATAPEWAPFLLLAF